MIEGKLCRVVCKKADEFTQLGPPTLLDEKGWHWPEVAKGDIVTVIGQHGDLSRHIEIDQFVVLAQVNEQPVVGWLYHYELEEVNSADQEQGGKQ